MEGFVVQICFTNLDSEMAKDAFSRMRIVEPISARGCWRILEDEDADIAYVDGQPVNTSQRQARAYANCLVTPLLSSLADLGLVKAVMNELYCYGAIMTSTTAIKIHFQNSPHRGLAKKVARKLIPGNGLAYTSYAFPYLLAPICNFTNVDPRRYKKFVAELGSPLNENYKTFLKGLTEGDEAHTFEKILVRQFTKGIIRNMTSK